MILDTNALSAWREGHPSVLEKLARLPAVFLPAPVLGEYRFGLLQSSRRVEMEAWLDSAETICEVLPVTGATARLYAAIRLELKRQGRPIPVNDLWIAALVCETRQPLLSNDRHFDLVEGITRIGW